MGVFSEGHLNVSSFVRADKCTTTALHMILDRETGIFQVLRNLRMNSCDLSSPDYHRDGNMYLALAL